MELVELDLHNYQAHRKRKLQFKPGVTGITGINGSGKSCIISALIFLFTGEVDTDTKADSITAGETEGWVKGKFTHNGKEGVMERHLQGSKVSLTYDGETLNKATEVNALWNDMLKIDSTIFNNVIVAKQGEIQKLFSDESSVREKIFQKIFLVPPTEKLRSLIWNTYVKNCPPEKPAEDVVGLQAQQAEVAANRNRTLKEAEEKTLQLADAQLLKCVADQVAHLERCQRDSAKRPELDQALLGAHARVGQLQAQIKKIEAEKYNTILPGLKQRYETLLLNKRSFERASSIRTELSTLSRNSTSQEEADRLREQLATAQEQASELQEIGAGINSRIKELAGRITKFSQLSGHAECPTCNQVLPDIQAFLADLRQQEAEAKTQSVQHNHKAALLGKQLQQYNTKLAAIDTVNQRTLYLNNELLEIGEVQYSEVDCSALKGQIQCCETNIQKLAQSRIDVSKAENEIAVLNEKLNNLSVYSGDSTIEAELAVMRTALQENDRVQAEVDELELQAAKLQHELELYTQRIQLSESNKVYNDRRKLYIERLTLAHDVFHVSRFPRKLIESYMDQVQTAMSSYLSYFDMPYSVSIGDGFKIRMKHSNGETLPKVSGGQEIVIGICLRLALHKMFSKAFPIWIIDEGTTHLHKDQKTNYFNLINELRNQRVINQIIAIDHDDGLMDVVDQSIVIERQI